MVFCDNKKCSYNESQVCTCKRIVLMNGSCATKKENTDVNEKKKKKLTS